MIEAPAPGERLKVQRWTRLSRDFTIGVGVLTVALAFVPLVLDSNVVQLMTNLLILVILAVMWNALAGYGGLLSVGQQAFIGIGAYGTVFFAQYGVAPYTSMILAMHKRRDRSPPRRRSAFPTCLPLRMWPASTTSFTVTCSTVAGICPFRFLSSSIRKAKS